MALRTFIDPNDCVEQFERSAEEHQEAGLILLAANSAQGVALMALSVEMLLKASYFRFIGFPRTRPVGMEELRDMQADFTTLRLPFTSGSGSLHDLQVLAAGVITVRNHGLPSRAYSSNKAQRNYAAVAASPMTARDITALTRSAVRLMSNWSIGDRYRSLSRAVKQDLEDVFDDAAEVGRLYYGGRI